MMSSSNYTRSFDLEIKSMFCMERIRKLTLDPYVNIVLCGGAKDSFLEEWLKEQQKIPTLFDSMEHPACVATKHNDMISNIWIIDQRTVNNGRYFFSDHIDHSLVVVSSKTDSTGNLTEYIGLLAGLCPKVPIHVTILVDPDSKKTGIELEEHAKSLGVGVKVERTVLTKSKQLVINLIEQTNTERRQVLNKRFKLIFG